MSRARAGKTSRQKDARAARQTKAIGGEAKAIPSSDVHVGGDPSRRAATHLIPKESLRPGVTVEDPRNLSNVPANETPPTHVLDPAGTRKREEVRQTEHKEMTRKRNESFAEQEGQGIRRGAAASVPTPRAPRTSRDRAIIDGKPYDNSQAGDFRDSSQQDGKAPEERFIHPGKKKGIHPEIAPGKTAQQADDLIPGEGSGEEDEDKRGEKKDKK